MNNMSFRQSLASAAVATALGLSSIPADAVVYSSSFDPPDFDGVATFDVDQACLDVGTGFVTNGSYTGCDVTWLSATVTLREPSTTPRTFSYDPGFLPSPTAVFNIFVQSGELAGVNSAAIGPVIISGDPNPNFNGPWWIGYSFTPSSPGEFGLGIVNLFTGFCDGRACSRNDTPSEVAQVLNFTRISQVIPEPGTLGLILGALGGAWFARWRKKLTD